MPYKIVSIKNKKQKQKTMISRKNTLFRYKGLCYAKIHMLRLISGKKKKKKKNRKYLLGDRSTQGQNTLKNPRWPPLLCKSDENLTFFFPSSSLVKGVNISKYEVSGTNNKENSNYRRPSP